MMKLGFAALVAGALLGACSGFAPAPPRSVPTSWRRRRAAARTAAATTTMSSTVVEGVTAIVLAGGVGSRMKADRPKQVVGLRGG